MNIELYFLRSSEHFIVKELLLYAARLDECGESLEDHPYLEQYHRNYGNFNGDIGVYAFVDNKVAGGAWVRMLANGFGFVDNQTPELAFAVLPEFRNQGIGTKIIEQLMREVVKSYPKMSLSVHEENPAIRLFERLGFAKVESSRHKGIVDAPSFTMVHTLEEQAIEADKNAKLEEERFRKSYSF